MNIEELSGLDAAFLYLETPKIPMHIGGVSIIEGSLPFDDFRQFVQDRLHTVEKLTQKLAMVPMSLDRPYWVDDADFDLSLHVHRVKLPRPGGWKELRHLASSLFSQQLNRERPLWEFIFVEEIDSIPKVPKGSVALISKLHHCGFDGMSGADLMSMLFDVSPKPQTVAPPRLKIREDIPSPVGLITKSAYHFFTRPRKLPSLLWDTGKSALKVLSLARSQGITGPTMPFSAPKTSFNDTVEAGRVWDSVILDINQVKALRNAVQGATLNDVILAICAGALRRYLLKKNELPDKPLVAMIPVSNRTAEEKNSMGNQVFAMYVQLATDLEDPIKRLEKICLNTVIAKLYQDVTDAKGLMGYAELIPFGLAGVAAGLYTLAGIAKLHKPFFNVIITNVPGAQTSLYIAGHKLIMHMGAAPIFDGMGLIMPIYSYNGSISISPTSALNLMPDMDDFTLYISESAEELEEAVKQKMNEAAVLKKFLEHD
jgi:diacylglycerol O-acyltransferase